MLRSTADLLETYCAPTNEHTQAGDKPINGLSPTAGQVANHVWSSKFSARKAVPRHERGARAPHSSPSSSSLVFNIPSASLGPNSSFQTPRRVGTLRHLSSTERNTPRGHSSAPKRSRWSVYT